jgi:carboxymethylenebutenolidase
MRVFMGVTFATLFGPALAAAHWRWFVWDRDAPKNPASFLIRKNHYQTCLHVNYTPERFRVNRGDMSWRSVAMAIFVIAALIEPLYHASSIAEQGGDRAGALPGGRQGAAGGGGRGGGGLATKNPELPAGAFTASSTVARTTLRHEWVEIPYTGQRLRTWIEYPNRADPAPVVIVMAHEAGLDDWMRAIADQLATDGFIAVAPDILSGRGPNGGNFDSFRFAAAVIRANEQLPQEEALRRYRAALDYARQLPRASGTSASLGVGMGGADSFRFAAEVADLNAAVTFYGAAPEESVLAKVKAPVAGFYGEDDPRVVARARAAEGAMKRLRKTYEVHIYPGATQAFMRSTVEGRNGDAVADAWPAAIQFLRRYLN